MQITVVGHLCFDAIHRKDARGEDQSHESVGGIYFTVATLSQLMSGTDSVVPVFGVGAKEYPMVLEQFSRMPHVSTDGLFSYDGPSNRVHLFYNGQQSRTECSKHIAPPIPFDRIRPHLANADGVLINMISGFDITLETLDQIRMETRRRSTPLHFDFHSLTLGIDGNATRFRRPVADWRRWCFMLHSVQMSNEEAAGLTAEAYDERALIHQIMTLMVSSVVITRGERGAILARLAGKKVAIDTIPGIPAPPPADPTGCGDVFGAAFFHRSLSSHDPLEAATFANSIAALNATFPGSEGLVALKERIAKRET